MGPKTRPMLWGTNMKLVIKYQISAINSCWKRCDEKCAYMFNVYKNQLSRQTGSRNRTDPKTLPTIWYTYITIVTKYQISAINSYWEKCDDKYPYIMASRFRLGRDSYFQATNNQWAYLLKLETRQDMLIDWSLTFNSISFSVMWGSIFSIYQSPVSLLFNIGYTPRDCVRLVNILNCFA
jgi:hypothetical protein